MILLARILLTLFLVAIALFSIYGFACTFEALPAATQWTWRAIYTFIFLANAYVIYRVWRRPR